MPNPIVRAGPSGKRLAPVNALGQKNWSAAAPLTLELARAGHMPGVYQFSIAIFPIVAAGAGTMTIAGNFDAPGFGATSVNFAAGSAINNGFVAPRHIMSSGLGAITLTLTPSGVTGSPLIYVNCPLDFILARFPSDYPS